MIRNTSYTSFIRGGGYRLLVVVLVLVTTVATASAAGTTAVELTSDDRIDAGELTTVSILVTDATDGVGAYNLTVALTNPSVARITDFNAKGDPSEETTDIDIAADGSTVTARVALMNTTDSGSVQIATLAVRGEAAGETNLALSVRALGDERGEAYETTTQDSRLVVERDDSTSGSSNSDEGASDSDTVESTETATSTVVTPTGTKNEESTLTDRPTTATATEPASAHSDTEPTKSPTPTPVSQATAVNQTTGIVPDLGNIAPVVAVPMALLAGLLLLWRR